MVRSARRRFNLVSSVVSHGYGNGPVAALIARRYGHLEARDSNFRSKNVRPRVGFVGRYAVSHRVYIYIYVFCYQPTGKLYGPINRCWTTMDGD